MIKHKRGKGIVRRQLHNKYIHRTGNGIFDFLKPITNIVRGVFAHKDLISKAVNTAKDVYTIGKNTKDIITSIRKPPIIDAGLEDMIRKPPIVDTGIEDIINKINDIRVRKSGKGFAYI